MHASYYMDESVSGQGEANPAFWLATPAGKMSVINFVFAILLNATCLSQKKHKKELRQFSAILTSPLGKRILFVTFFLNCWQICSVYLFFISELSS